MAGWRPAPVAQSTNSQEIVRVAVQLSSGRNLSLLCVASDRFRELQEKLQLQCRLSTGCYYKICKGNIAMNPEELVLAHGTSFSAAEPTKEPDVRPKRGREFVKPAWRGPSGLLDEDHPVPPVSSSAKPWQADDDMVFEREDPEPPLAPPRLAVPAPVPVPNMGKGSSSITLHLHYANPPPPPPPCLLGPREVPRDIHEDGQTELHSAPQNYYATERPRQPPLAPYMRQSPPPPARRPDGFQENRRPAETHHDAERRRELEKQRQMSEQREASRKAAARDQEKWVTVHMTSGRNSVVQVQCVANDRFRHLQEKLQMQCQPPRGCSYAISKDSVAMNPDDIVLFYGTIFSASVVEEEEEEKVVSVRLVSGRNINLRCVASDRFRQLQEKLRAQGPAAGCNYGICKDENIMNPDEFVLDHGTAFSTVVMMDEERQEERLKQEAQEAREAQKAKRDWQRDLLLFSSRNSREVRVVGYSCCSPCPQPWLPCEENELLVAIGYDYPCKDAVTCVRYTEGKFYEGSVMRQFLRLEEPCEFTFEVVAPRGGSFGITFRVDMEMGSLRVDEVHPNTVSSSWNENCALRGLLRAIVRKNDSIISVSAGDSDGYRTTPEKMMDAIAAWEKSGGQLKAGVRRGDREAYQKFTS